MPTYKTLSQKHPEYDGLYWRRCRALYAGGKKLLGDRAVMEAVFPQHLAEHPKVYAERMTRAYYIPYAGEIIGQIVSALFGEQLKIDGPDAAGVEWLDDVSPPGGNKQTIAQFMKEQLVTALCCQRAWTLIDLPTAQQAKPKGKPGEVAPVGTLLEQEKLGLLDAYAVPLDPECVWDWETEADGKLIWILVRKVSTKRDGIEGTRGKVTETWTYYTATDWQRYEIAYPVGKPPDEGVEIPLVDGGTHTFGEVPALQLVLPEGLWAMGKIECIAVAHLNKRNALSWSMYKSLFPVLAHFVSAPDPMNPITDDPDRALNQTIGQGYVMQLADRDKLEFVGPSGEAYAIASSDLSVLRDEMHRVLHQMALSVDNSAAALGRSADSKQIDQSSASVVLRELGKYVREHVEAMLALRARGRGEQAPEIEMAGMDNYADVSVDAIVTQAQTLELVPVPSATFQVEMKYKLAKRVLGDNGTDKILDKIRTELEANITNESFQRPEVTAGMDLEGKEIDLEGKRRALENPEPVDGKAS